MTPEPLSADRLVEMEGRLSAALVHAFVAGDEGPWTDTEAAAHEYVAEVLSGHYADLAGALAEVLRLREALPGLIGDAWLAGFMQSAEGENGEYPYEGKPYEHLRQRAAKIGKRRARRAALSPGAPEEGDRGE